MLAAFDAAVGPHSIITFQEFPFGTALGNQYLVSDGVVFTDGNDFIEENTAFETDAVGVDAGGSISLRFSSAINAIGAEFPGALKFQLMLGSSLVYTSSQFSTSGSGFFGGVSGVTFDGVLITDPVDNLAYVDNLHFALVTPEPSPALLLCTGLGLLALVRKGRKSASR